MSSSYILDPRNGCRNRFECKEPLYKNTQYCVLHYPTENKILDFDEARRKKLSQSDFNFRGVWFPAKADFRNQHFNQEVIFKQAIFHGDADFTQATFDAEATFSDVRFHAKAQFGSASFQKSVTFRGAIVNGETNLNSAVFKQRANLKAHFKGKCDFSQSEFGDLTEFTDAVFEKDANFYKGKFLSISRFDDAKFIQITNFDEVLFHERVNFNAAVFHQEVNFRGAVFEERVLFDATQFKRAVDFHLATFKDYVRFKGAEVFLRDSPPNFRETKFVHPELVSFHTVHLRPFWFVEVDATNFVLTNVSWDWHLITIDQERDGVVRHYKGLSSPDAAFSLLSIACWNFAVNAEENHRYEEASDFRYLAMELRRRHLPFRTTYGKMKTSKTDVSARSTFPQSSETRPFRQSLTGTVGVVHRLYWLLSGYGEKIVRALLVLIGIWLVFAILYAILLRDNTGTRLGWRGAHYSAAVLTLQKPEPHPSPGIAHALVTLETILGPVQAALLALAIRRKFMR